MISDVLFDSVVEINRYLEDQEFQELYGDEVLSEIRGFVSRMEELARKLGAPPLPLMAQEH